jgi:hypothetical protein
VATTKKPDNRTPEDIRNNVVHALAIYVEDKYEGRNAITTEWLLSRVPEQDFQWMRMVLPLLDVILKEHKRSRYIYITMDLQELSKLFDTLADDLQHRLRSWGPYDG